MRDMKGMKNVFSVMLMFACSFSFAQNSLLDFYKNLAFSRLPITDNLRTTVYQPLKATNYIWGASTWNFTDTTLYTYTATNKIASQTKKNSSNNFISRVLNSYDASDNLIEQINQNWSSAWVNNNRDTFAFDTYNNLTIQEHHQWNTSQWVRAGGYRYFYTYNGAGKVLTKLTVTWNTSTLVWDSVSRQTNSYNAGNQVTQMIGESYSMSIGWQLISRKDYSYDASFINIQTTTYAWSGTQWVNNNQLINITWHTWTGDVNTSDPLNYIYQLWNSTSWDNYNRLTYTYDAFGGVIQFTEFFASGNWRNDSRLSDFYDNQYNYTGTRSEAWNVVASQWDTSYEYKYIHTYDVNNSITQTVYQFYDVLNHAFVNDSKTVYSDFILMSVAGPAAAVNRTAEIYPNPFSGSADVILQGINKSFQYRIYNSTGRLMRAGEEKSNFRIQRAELPAGLYLLQITDQGRSSFILKFIVQ